jgi:hypothetical protein
VSGRKHRKTRKVVKAVLCPQCGRSSPPTPASLLAAAAAALAALEDAGMRVRLRHDAVITSEGYVLPLKADGDGRWVARTNSYTPFTPPAEAADDLDD